MSGMRGQVAMTRFAPGQTWRQRVKGFCVIVLMMGLCGWGLGLGCLGPVDLNSPDGSVDRIIPPKKETLENNVLELDESSFAAQIKEKEAVISFVVRRKQGAPVTPLQGHIKLQLTTLVREVHATLEKSFTLAQDQKQLSIQVVFPKLPADLSYSNAGRYVIAYQVSTGSSPLLYGYRSLYSMLPPIGLNITGNRYITVGQPGFLRMMVYHLKTQKPLTGADILLSSQGKTLFSGRTDAAGQLAAEIKLPLIWGPGNHIFHVTAKTAFGTLSEQGTWTLRAKKQDKEQILLTTDKPTYQPGQTIHLRTLAMRMPAREPVANQLQTFEIEDPKGNKLFKQTVTTNAYGVASTSFKLAQELNMGSFTISVTSSQGSAKKNVTVERYSLPKFEILWHTSTTSLRPGDVLKGTVEARYFFGKPVAAGAIEVTVTETGSQYKLGKISGTLDEEGKYQLSFNIPRSFPFPAGAQTAALALDVKVLDAAQQEVTKSFSALISTQKLWLHLVSEAKVKVGVENTFFVFATTPGGSRIPVSGEIVWNQSALKTPFQTNEHDIAVVRLKLPAFGKSYLSYNIQARDAQGQVYHHSGNLSVTSGAGNIAIQTDRTIVAAGQQVKVTLLAEQPSLSLTVDLRSHTRTVSSQRIQLNQGKASLSIDIPDDLHGIVQLEVYALDSDHSNIAETKALYVDGNNSLKVAVTLDKSSYKPAQQAQVKFQVTDAQGKPTRAVLGVQVVDEAVFARTEFKPGLARLFFHLTEDLLGLSNKVAGGFRVEDLAKGPAPEPKAQEQREWAARLLLSYVQNTPYDLHLQSQASSRQVIKGATASYLQLLSIQISRDFANWAWREKISYSDVWSRFQSWTRSQQDTWIDPWGRPLQLSFDEAFQRLGLKTWGPDETQDTWDDSTVTVYPLRYYRGYSSSNNNTNNSNTNGNNMNSNTNYNSNNNNSGGWGAETSAPESVPSQDAGSPGQPDSDEPKPPPANTVRIRKDFPETLKFVPSLITDPSGMASMKLDLADSITSWRMTTLASSSKGQIGSTLTGIKVFQPFFVDMDLPPTLTRLDEVGVLVAVYNYLPQEQTVQLKLQSSNWFDLLDSADKTVNLKANEVKSLRYRIRVKKLRQQTLTVIGVGGQEQDGAARSLWIEPNGKRHTINLNGRLSKSVQHKVTFPQGIVPESQQIFVKIYPGLVSHVVEGLDSMLRQPYGCFEQTSSTTYPNVLILDYLRSSSKSNPAIEKQALAYIRAGYQRLTSYEVQGGGFEWFGNTPAHVFLTAYGVFEFFDMKKVYPIDERMLSRTQDWLARQQQPDGSWTATRGYDHWGKFGRAKLVGTAYVLWALAATGYKGSALQRAAQFVRNEITTGQYNDPYTLALVSNALLHFDPTASDASALLKKLDATKTTEKDACYWTASGQTLTYGSGSYANVETTSMILQAMIKQGGYADTISCGVNWLIQRKKTTGHWGTTQATIQALRTLIQVASSQTSNVNATIDIKWGNETIKSLVLDQTNEDIMQQIDLSHKAIVGDNTVSIEFKGTGSMMYQIVGVYYVPWTSKAPSPGPLAMQIQYDKTNLAVNDIVKVSVSIENTQTTPMQQVVAELGIPPGFIVNGTALDQLVKQGILGRWEKKNETIVVYIPELKASSKLELTYTMQVTFPFKGSVPSSKVYLYYNPDVAAITQPFPIEVQ